MAFLMLLSLSSSRRTLKTAQASPPSVSTLLSCTLLVRLPQQRPTKVETVQIDKHNISSSLEGNCDFFCSPLIPLTYSDTVKLVLAIISNILLQLKLFAATTLTLPGLWGITISQADQEHI